ncbi:hypothetical protein SAMN04487760_11017 [Lachnospiraceae bacterium G41]|nr:hypothetical protein SAMN04487760_11017 [Lachnospiraceae bacterium G41]
MGTVSFMGIILKIFFIALIVISIIAIIKNKDMKKIVVLPLILEALSVFGLAFADVAEYIISLPDLHILSKLSEWTFIAYFAIGPVFALAGIIISVYNRLANLDKDHRALWLIGLIGNIVSFIISVLMILFIVFIIVYVAPVAEHMIEEFFHVLRNMAGYPD